MKRTVLILSLIAVTVLSGCSTLQPTEPVVIEKNPRIIERDLTKHYTATLDLSESEQSQETEQPVKVITKVMYKPAPQCAPGTLTAATGQVIQPIANGKEQLLYDVIEFANESIALNDQEKLDAMVDLLQEDDLIYLIGHSHGWSRYGTHKLATQRADVVFNHLTGKGIDPQRIYKLASWSKTSAASSPARGVQVYVINKHSKHEDAQLFLALL